MQKIAVELFYSLEEVPYRNSLRRFAYSEKKPSAAVALALRATFFSRRASLRLAFRLSGEDWLGSSASFLDLGPIALAMSFRRL